MSVFVVYPMASRVSSSNGPLPKDLVRKSATWFLVWHFLKYTVPRSWCERTKHHAMARCFVASQWLPVRAIAISASLSSYNNVPWSGLLAVACGSPILRIALHRYAISLMTAVAA